MIKKLVLTALLAMASLAAQASDFGNPIAYVNNSKGGTLILTDKEDKKLCPPGSYLAVAVNSPKGEPLVGCWVAVKDDYGDTSILVAWLPDYNVQEIPARLFHPVEKAPPPTQTLSL